MAAANAVEVGVGMAAFFTASSIAMVGASDDKTKIGGRPIDLLKKHGYGGAIYPVNPKGGTIQGLPAYASLPDTPTAPELAVLAVPPSGTVAALHDCAARGVQAVIVLSSGFAEMGTEGAALQAQLVQIAQTHGMRLLGPNCLGAVDIAQRVIGTFSIALEAQMPPAGQVAIVSQSGNVGSHTLQCVAQRGVGISRFIATGNEADVDVADGIAAMVHDPATRVILCCIETCRHAGKLIAALRLARTHGKPVVVLKIGASEKGQAAAASHTGALAGSDAVMDAVLRRYGALRVRSVEALVDIGHTLVLRLPNRLPRNRAVTLVAASGGFGIMMADAMSEVGLGLPDLAPQTQARIRAAVPIASTGNPVDATAQMSSRPDILFQMLTAVLDDPSDGTVVLFLALSLHNPRLRTVFLDALTQVSHSHPERCLCVISQGPPDAVAALNALGIPVFSSIDAAAHALAGLVQWTQLQAQPQGEAPALLAPDPVDPTVFQHEFHAKRALAQAGIPVPQEALAQNVEQAVQAAQAIGYPVAMKIVSADIQHKTEVGGVVLDVGDDSAVRAAHAQLLTQVAQRAPNARIDGVLVAPMVRGGTEMIAGISQDPIFGPVVMVGMGGVYAEVLNDVAVQVAPVNEEEALAMIRSLKMFALLDGARGRAKADIAAVAHSVVRLSEFAVHHRADIAEIDMNPILVKAQGQGAVVLDALMIPHAQGGQPKDSRW